MAQSVKLLKNLVGEFVDAQTVREATQKEYNQSEWIKNVDRYTQLQDNRFFKTPGTIYEFDYYVIYISNGIRFLQEISYSSSLTNEGFAVGFYTKGCKDVEAVAKLKELDAEVYKGFDKDQLTILSYTEGRIDTNDKARGYMRLETESLRTRFFTKCF